MTRDKLGLPATIQLICDAEPRAGKTGAWIMKRGKFYIRILKKYKGEDKPDIYYRDVPDIDLSGTDIETEGAAAAEKAYFNIVCKIDENGEATFTKHEKSENYILKPSTD